EMAEDGVSSGSASGSHVVQAWPSGRASKATSKAPAAQMTLDPEGLDAGFSPGPLDPGHLDPDQSGEKDYGPFRRRHPTFTGSGRTLFGIFTTNTVWTLLTLGLYSFWGRIKIRRYFHSQTKFAGSRFAFYGTGGELLLGWIKALLAFGIPYSALHYASGQHTEVVWQWSLNGLAGILVVCFIPVAIVGSHRYRMSRTSWRSIRFSFRRSAAAFTAVYLKGILLSLVTLGIYYPVFDHARRAFLTSGTHFGNQAFSFDGDPKVLGQLYFKAFRRLVLTLVTAIVFLWTAKILATQFRPEHVVDLVFQATVGAGAIVTPILIGLWFWFQAAKQRYMWNHTTFGPSRFRATMKGGQIFELKCTNLILLVGSLGLAWPWVQKRNLQFLYYHLGLRGPLGLQHILQQATSASPMGEELAGFFDAGFEM
ncbi:MAG: YjgN family protein, partial [Nitrospirota bacterium]|nr:YjgN family protein [Nitrospirota bacterium]